MRTYLFFIVFLRINTYQISLIHTLTLAPDWKLINILSQIDRFGGSWIAIEKRESNSLKQLKSIATVRSVGASTRIEGSKMTDAEVEVLLNNLSISKLEERDQQEVVGYFETLDIIAESYQNIDITENNIKMLHNVLMKHSEKDAWHRGNYKQHSNVVEATQPDGSKYVVFKTTDPGFATDDAMRQLIEWYKSDTEAHPIVRAAIVVYDFLSIHPFQDGNGRLSRLLGTLLLLKNGYSWIQYVSFEHEIESRKGEYYRVLMECQRKRPGEDVYPWVSFFLDGLINIQSQLMDKLKRHSNTSSLSPKEKKILAFIEAHPGAQSGDVATKLDMPLPSVKRLIMDMVEKKLLVKHGVGKGTHYTLDNVRQPQKDFVFKLTDGNRVKEFRFVNPDAMIEIKKLILTPLFDWKVPTEWGTKLLYQNLAFKIILRTARNSTVELPTYSISGLINPNFFNPIFVLQQPIRMPNEERGLMLSDYPITVTIELTGTAERFDFDVDFVYDGILD
jgi:Fic family protein